MKILQVDLCPLTNQEVSVVVKRELEFLKKDISTADRERRLATVDPAIRSDMETLRRREESATNISRHFEQCYPMVQRCEEACLSAFLAGISRFPVSDAEVVQILNLAPCDPVLFSGVLSDCYVRFTDEQIDYLCDLVRHHLLGGPPPALQLEDVLPSPRPDPAAAPRLALTDPPPPGPPAERALPEAAPAAAAPEPLPAALAEVPPRPGEVGAASAAASPAATPPAAAAPAEPPAAEAAAEPKRRAPRRQSGQAAREAPARDRAPARGRGRGRGRGVQEAAAGEADPPAAAEPPAKRGRLGKAKQLPEDAPAAAGPGPAEAEAADDDAAAVAATGRAEAEAAAGSGAELGDLAAAGAAEGAPAASVNAQPQRRRRRMVASESP